MTYRARSGRFASIRKLGWHRAAAGLLVPLIAVLVLQIRYYAPHHVKDINIAGSPTDEPLAARTGVPPVIIAMPQPSAERIARTGSLLVELRPLRLSQERAPPSPGL